MNEPAPVNGAENHTTEQRTRPPTSPSTSPLSPPALDPNETSGQRLPHWLPLYPRRIRWSLAGSLTALILIFSLIPDLPLPRDTTDSIGLPVHVDKLAHFAAYLLLTLALCYARYHPQATARRTALFSLLAAAALGLLVELLQGVLPHRQLEPGDLIANVIGAAVAAFLWLALTGLMKNRVQETTG